MPAIRYPLFWIAGCVIVALIALLARPAIQALTTPLQKRWQRLVEGPPLPASTEPQSLAGNLPRSALLLRDPTDLRKRPGGATAATLRRQFVLVYDQWPLSGEPSALRVGTGREALGWVDMADVLDWPTRLVYTPATSEVELADRPGGSSSTVTVPPGVPLPVLQVRDDALRLAIWKGDGLWTHVAAEKWLVCDDRARAQLGLLLTRFELLALQRALNSQPTQALAPLERASVGAISRPDPTLDPATAAQQLLPGILPPIDAAALRRWIAIRNQQWNPSVAWSGLTFDVLPLIIPPSDH